MKNNVAGIIKRLIGHVVFGSLSLSLGLLCFLIIILIEILQYQLQLQFRISLSLESAHPFWGVFQLSNGTWDMHLSYLTIAFNAQHIFYDAFGQMESNGMARRLESQLVSGETLKRG